MEVPNVSTEKELKEKAVDIEMKYNVSESMGEAPLKPLLTFSLTVEESDPDLLISYFNQSLMRASNGMKELDGFSFGVKPSEGLQPKGFESILHPMPWFKRNYCILHKADLDCFDEGHQQNSRKRWLTDEITT